MVQSCPHLDDIWGAGVVVVALCFLSGPCPPLSMSGDGRAFVDKFGRGFQELGGDFGKFLAESPRTLFAKN